MMLMWRVGTEDAMDGSGVSEAAMGGMEDGGAGGEMLGNGERRCPWGHGWLP